MIIWLTINFRDPTPKYGITTMSVCQWHTLRIPYRNANKPYVIKLLHPGIWRFSRRKTSCGSKCFLEILRYRPTAIWAAVLHFLELCVVSCLAATRWLQCRSISVESRRQTHRNTPSDRQTDRQTERERHAHGVNGRSLWMTSSSNAVGFAIRFENVSFAEYIHSIT